LTRYLAYDMISVMPLPKLKPHVKAAWVAALRDPSNRQARNMLESQSGAMCCLGVLSKVAAGEGICNRTSGIRVKYNGADMYPPAAVAEWAFEDAVDSGERVDLWFKFADFNDEKGWSFKRIAAYVERYM
jgi:hypothetical protein